MWSMICGEETPVVFIQHPFLFLLLSEPQFSPGLLDSQVWQVKLMFLQGRETSQGSWIVRGMWCVNQAGSSSVDGRDRMDLEDIFKQILIGFGQGEVERAPSHQLCKCQWWWNVSMEGSQWALLLPNITTTLRDIRLLSITLLSCFPDEKTEMYWCLKNWQLARSVARI